MSHCACQTVSANSQCRALLLLPLPPAALSFNTAVVVAQAKCCTLLARVIVKEAREFTLLADTFETLARLALLIVRS